MSPKKLAKIINVILGPQLWFPLMIFVGIFRSGLSINQIQIILPSTFFLMVVIPLGYLIIAPRFGWISGWEMKNKKERIPFFKIILVSTVITLLIILLFGNKLLLDLTLILMTTLVLLFIVTRYWKISLHTSLNTLGSIIVNFLFNWKVPLLYLSIPIIYWARNILKRHSSKQLYAGIILTATATILGLKLFGYI